ncbi:hypothetical protein F4556_005217 [Kitasatospora gansuensis]|uniref:Integrase n=1 Tax=Kitasatospora gansuensis TaxID=258050 RepID=A0A7W7SFZ7_9ACTN|nr:hypothetical protein [Kitasatospora gansuensis]MBB4949682.1 hypothetical protein [Kitasatospora gansuensis]
MATAEKVYKVRNGQKTKQFSWRCVYIKPDGNRGFKPGFPTLRKAKDWGNAEEAKVKAGTWIDPDLATLQFGTWAREWMGEKAPRGRTTTTRWEKLEAHILPRWEHVPLRQINWFDAENWANRVGEAADDGTASKCLTIMSQMLTGAVDAKKLESNPLAGRRRSRTAAIKAKNQVKQAAKSKAPATPEQVLLLARRVGPLDGMHVLTTGFLGPRWGEGIAFIRASRGTREEAHRGGIWTCPTLMVRDEVAEYQIRDPKTGKKGPIFFGLEPVKTDGSLRDIDVPPFLDALLDEHEARLPAHIDTLFCTRSGVWWRNSNFGRQVMRPGADGREPLPKVKGHRPREGWDPIVPGLTMDFLRHLHDSLQAELKVAEPLAYEQAGHVRAGIKAVYQHPTVESRIERLAGLQGIFEKAMATLGWDRIWEQS